MKMQNDLPYTTYREIVWKRFCKKGLNLFFLFIILLFAIVGLYAPFLASSKPFIVYFQGHWYFPLFRYLFYPQFFSKPLDIFYNLLMFTLPLFFFLGILLKKRVRLRLFALSLLAIAQVGLFFFLILFPPRDPNFALASKRNSSFPFLNWEEEKKLMSPYAQLNLLLRYQQAERQKKEWQPYEERYAALANSKGRFSSFFPSLWNFYIEPQSSQKELGESYRNYVQEKRAWMEKEAKQLRFELWPFLRNFHAEEEAGGDALLNELVPWYQLTRINRRDMVASLIFGIRISLSVGLLSIAIALAIAIPIGALSGYYGGKFDLLLYRLIEIWESMPTFFMLLAVIAFAQSKSIFLIILLIALFGWTGFSRFLRGEFLRQKKLLYVEACHSLGYSDAKIIFSEILPNALPPLLTLVPFAIMGAITSEAALSFLGLGEEGSNSWGVLMDEGRSAFPSESYLLWPPAILLTLLLIAIANVGDGLRDALDPKS